jgi:hypothetical protein
LVLPREQGVLQKEQISPSGTLRKNYMLNAQRRNRGKNMGETCEPKVEAKDTSNQASTATKIAVVFGILSIVLAVIVIMMSVNIIPTMNSNRSARLINVGMGGYDNAGSRTLHVSGYVVNVGLETAYKCQLHITAVYTQGGEAINTYIPIDPQIIYSQQFRNVDVDVGYSAPGLGSWEITPEWTYTP